MAYQYKNGMRYLVTEEDKNNTAGYHFHSDISAKIGTEGVRTLKLHVDTKVSAGAYIPLKVKLKKLHSVKLNRYALTPKLDYILKDNSAIAFTFNLTASDKVEIEGYVDAI
jgi:hypothetical protein